MRQIATTKSTKPMKQGRAAAISPVLKGGMPRALGIRIVSLTRKKVVGEMPIKPMHVNNSGSVNGGAIMSFADVLGAAGAVAHRPPGYRGGTIESKTNFFAAGRGPVLSAVSIPLHVGRTTTVWQTTVTNPDGRVVAIVTQTQIMIPHERERAPGAGRKRASRSK
jgi:1,4-dihydroxy-2-naphthoyl-CoA hydrolase